MIRRFQLPDWQVFQYCFEDDTSLKLDIPQTFMRTPKTNYRHEILKFSVDQANKEGLFLEFGVYRGASINYVASLIPDRTVYGFDSFEGLPESWIVGYKKGDFSLQRPPVVADNVELVVGLFQDVLEPWLDGPIETVSFVHFDADLYSSTKFVLMTLAEYELFRKGSVLHFHEVFGYSDWLLKGEYKALTEFVNETNIELEAIAKTCPSKMLSVKIL